MSENSRGYPLLVCGALFFSIFLGLYGLYLAAEPLLQHYFVWLAHSVAATLNLFDPAVGARDNLLLYGDKVELRVIEGCDGVTVFILIIAAVLAFPKPLKERLLGVVILLPLLFAINWLRLIVLAMIRYYWPEQFGLVHVYLFQPAMVLATFVCFIAWIVYDGNRSHTAEMH